MCFGLGLNVVGVGWKVILWRKTLAIASEQSCISVGSTASNLPTHPREDICDRQSGMLVFQPDRRLISN
jgi:hypothetical protein